MATRYSKLDTTISLTGRRPIRISKQEWPVIASARDWDSVRECDAHQKWKLVARRHQDGRTLVYGVHETAWQGANEHRGGEMLEAGGDVCDAIVRVGKQLGFEQELIDECLSDISE